MSISKKGLRKIERNNREFFWYVKKDDDWNQSILSIITDDKKFHVSYILGQKTCPIITVKGKEFKGVDNLGRDWKQFHVPDWESNIATPALVAQIIDWCFVIEDIVSIDYESNNY